MIRFLTGWGRFDSPACEARHTTPPVYTRSLHINANANANVFFAFAFHSDENDDGKMLALTVKKRRAPRDKTSWWSGVLEGDDKWEPQQLTSAEPQ